MNWKKPKQPIICVDCGKNSGYFHEDYLQKKDFVKVELKCKNCFKPILDKPFFPVEPSNN